MIKLVKFKPDVKIRDQFFQNLPFFQLTYSQLFKLINSSIISTMRGVDRSKVAAGSYSKHFRIGSEKDWIFTLRREIK